jgi:dCTP deaminase
MAFLGTNSIKQLLEGSDVISPFDNQKIKNGAYELSLGSQVFQTDSTPRAVKELKPDEKIEIKPGQFALLLTKEYIKMPKNKIAFITIKAGIKFEGLVNVSGFHVDPGFEGNLLFSVYNAGPSSIILSNGTSYFPIWFSELSETQEYEGKHNKQTKIPDTPVKALSQGELASPNALSKRIDEVGHIRKTNEWILRTSLGLMIAIGAKLWWDNNKLNAAIEFGYNKKSTEVVIDSLYRKSNSDIRMLNMRVDSLTRLLNEKRRTKATNK